MKNVLEIFLWVGVHTGKAVSHGYHLYLRVGAFYFRQNAKIKTDFGKVPRLSRADRSLSLSKGK